VERICNQGHVNLVETLAENIAAKCLKDKRLQSARVRVEKSDILEDAESVGVEIKRFNDKV
jgi:7,8-dihydroneopterin aldolase/epimerase/oxygenase